MTKIIPLFFLFLLSLSCDNQPIPKPKAMLRLEYPKAVYSNFSTPNCPFEFEKNTNGNASIHSDCSINIEYPKMKATIYLTYKPIQNNLINLLKDAQKLTYEHIVKATNIAEQPFENPNHKVFGMFYEVEGNAASQSQFYATDSLKHFITGSIYFKAKPNYDSIQPAAFYLKKDIRTILETLQWK